MTAKLPTSNNLTAVLGDEFAHVFVLFCFLFSIHVEWNLSVHVPNLLELYFFSINFTVNWSFFYYNCFVLFFSTNKISTYMYTAVPSTSRAAMTESTVLHFSFTILKMCILH